MSLHDFATRIQSAWRGYTTRKDYELAIKEYRQICFECEVNSKIEHENSKNRLSETTFSTVMADPYEAVQPFTKSELLKTRKKLARDLVFIRSCMENRIKQLKNDD